MAGDTYLRFLDDVSREPELVLDGALSTAAASRLWVAVAFDLECYWLADESCEGLIAVYRREAAGTQELAVAVVPRSADALQALQGEGDWFARLGVTPIAVAGPLPLAPVAIPKPWGREIWYTGIEKRGVAGVATGEQSVPLPWLLAAAPRRLVANRERDLILLKILDPLPDPVFGDLYFELHQEKREVYVVTEVDRRAWPDGVGAIRFGFDQALVDDFASPRQFLDAYLAAVAAYRVIREQIDARLETARRVEGVGSNEPVDAATLRRWLMALPTELASEEQRLRAAMERFTALRPLRVGDVVKVPHRVPHSLQHGVRTVEFQTPVYERLILSFAQKVLTQAGWDTASAAQVVEVATPPAEPFEQTGTGAGWQEERIVAFDDFEVRRITLEPGASYPLAAGCEYRLLMAVGGTVTMAGRELAADEALLLPVGMPAAELGNGGAEARVALLALPRPRH